MLSILWANCNTYQYLTPADPHSVPTQTETRANNADRVTSLWAHHFAPRTASGRHYGLISLSPSQLASPLRLPTLDYADYSPFRTKTSLQLQYDLCPRPTGVNVTTGISKRVSLTPKAHILCGGYGCQLRAVGLKFTNAWNMRPASILSSEDAGSTFLRNMWDIVNYRLDGPEFESRHFFLF